MSGKGNEAYEKFSREMGGKYGDLYEKITIPAPFDLNEPLPPLKAHPRSRSWEPAARHYRDIDETEREQA